MERIVGVPEVEHLKLIQAAVTRMAGHSFALKGWAVTLVAGLTALAKIDANLDVAWIACGVVVVFALLDAAYLATERKFRALYDTAAGSSTTDWSMKPGDVSTGEYLDALRSWSVWPLYLAAAAGAALVATSTI